MSFSGEFRVNLDEKNRTRIPAKLRCHLGDDIVVCTGTNGCAFIMDNEEFAKRFETVRLDTKLSDEAKQRLFRKLSASVYHLTEDAQGRFTIPPRIKELIQAEKGLVFLGVWDRIELWSEEKYADYIDPTNDELGSIWEALGM